MVVPLLTWVLAVPVELSAGRLEARGDFWWADGGIALSQGDLHLVADGARSLVDPACAGGRVRLLGPISLEAGETRAQAAEAEVCLSGGAAVVQQLAVVAPRLRLQADRATWQAGVVQADGVSVTACACDPAPWHFTARHADVEPDVGAWAEWPVLWVGPVPVATAPRWYVPLARRRTGFLLPIMGFDGDDGVHGRLPVFLTLGQSADLTLAPGYRQGRGLTGHGTLRWAASDHEVGTLEARSITSEGVVVAGRGALPAGPIRLAVEGSASTDEAVRQALWPGLADRRRDHLRGSVSASVAGRRTGLGLSAVRLEDLSRPETALDRSETVVPDLWMRWHAAAGPAELTLHGRTVTLLEDADPRTVADVGGEVEIPFWIGPLQLRPTAGGATTLHLDDGQGQTGAAWLGAEARLAAARTLGTLRHEVALSVDGRLAEADEPARNPLLAIDLPLESRALGATLETRLADPDVAARLALRLGLEGKAPVKGTEAPLVLLEVDAPGLRADGGTAGTEATWAHLVVGGSALHGQLGFTRLRPSDTTPTLRRLGPQRPLALSTLTGDLTTAEAGAGFEVGRLAVDYTLVADADAGTVLGQQAGLGWTSGCDCWSAHLGASLERGRDVPDVWLALSVP